MPEVAEELDKVVNDILKKNFLTIDKIYESSNCFVRELMNYRMSQESASKPKATTAVREEEPTALDEKDPKQEL